LGESAIDLNAPPTYASGVPSNSGEKNLGDISVGEIEDLIESAVIAKARREALRCQIHHTAATLEQLRLQEDDAAQIAAFKQSLISAKRARDPDGAYPQQRLALVDLPRYANPPAAVVQTALLNMSKAVVLHKMIDAPLAERFRDQARRPAFRTAWEEVIPEALEMIKLRLVNMQEEVGMTLADAGLCWLTQKHGVQLTRRCWLRPG
jgi:hypothetical protein